MARKKVPQGARLSAGGVQSLFGQCPNVGGVTQNGSSLIGRGRKIQGLMSVARVLFWLIDDANFLHCCSSTINQWMTITRVYTFFTTRLSIFSQANFFGDWRWALPAGQSWCLMYSELPTTYPPYICYPEAGNPDAWYCAQNCPPPRIRHICNPDLRVIFWREPCQWDQSAHLHKVPPA